MNVGIETKSNKDFCVKLKKKEDDFKRHAIYILDSDADTDFDLYVLVDSKEAREENGFLKELFNFLDNCNGHKKYSDFADESHKAQLKEWLGIKNDHDPSLTVLNWLKIAIEKYPYRLFVAVDEDKYSKYKKEVKKQSEDANTGSDSRTEGEGDKEKPELGFIDKRICWIEKEELEEALSENNKEILQISQNGQNLLENLSSLERAKLWLYYKWVEHLLDINGLNGLNVHLAFGGQTEQFYGLTFPLDHFKITAGVTDGKIDENIFFGRNGNKSFSWVLIDRHLDSHPVIKNNPNINWVYAESISGVQTQFPILHRASVNTFEGLKVYFWIIENALNKMLLVDERVLGWFYSLPFLNRFALFFLGIFPIEKFIGFNVRSNTGNNITLDGNLDFNISKSLLKSVLASIPSGYKNGSWNSNSRNNLIDKTLEKFRTTPSPQTLIIHQGILDKMDSPAHRLILSLKDRYPFVLITSGRGKPGTVPKGEKFIPFSSLDYLMRDYPEKLLLTKLIYGVVSKEE